MKFFLVVYDIADGKRRQKVAHRLEQAGQRVQESVFEVPLPHGANLARLKRDLGTLIHPEDSLRFYRLCQGCRAGSATLQGNAIALVPGLMLI